MTRDFWRQHMQQRLQQRLAELQKRCDESGVKLRLFKPNGLDGRHVRLIGERTVDYWPLGGTAFLLDERRTLRNVSIEDVVSLANS